MVTMNINGNEYDTIYPISLFKRNLNSVLRNFESKEWTHVPITRNNQPLADVTHPTTNLFVKALMKPIMLRGQV